MSISNITVETVNHQSNPVAGHNYVAAIIAADIDGEARRFLLNFVPTVHPEAPEVITGAVELAGGKLVFATDLDPEKMNGLVNLNSALLFDTALPHLAAAYLDMLVRESEVVINEIDKMIDAENLDDITVEQDRNYQKLLREERIPYLDSIRKHLPKPTQEGRSMWT